MTSRPGASEPSTGLSARLRSVVPALRWLPAYDGGWFRGDAVAGITLPNAGSVALHEALGFERIGVYKEVGFKFGAWHDSVWYQRGLA